MRISIFVLSSVLGVSACGGPRAESKLDGAGTLPLKQGVEVGNGGGGVVCRDTNGAITSVELIDFWVGRNEWSFTLDLGSGSFMDKVNHALQRLARFDNDRAIRYTKKAALFLANVNWLTNSVLPAPGDTDDLVKPAGNCQFETVALQRNPQFPAEKFYRINKDLWDKMDDTNKAGLILHEIIYEEALVLKQTNSRKTRYYNANLASTAFSGLPELKYIDLVRTVGFPYMFVWHDDVSGKTWRQISDNPWAYCTTAGYKMPIDIDVKDAFPRLSKRLQSLRLITDLKQFEILINANNWSGSAVLYADKYFIQSSQGIPGHSPSNEAVGICLQD